MNINQRLDMLEEKVDLILKHLDLQVKQPPASVPEVDQTANDLAVEVQRLTNHINMLKIKFRKTPPRSPVRDEILEEIENTIQKRDALKEQL